MITALKSPAEILRQESSRKQSRKDKLRLPKQLAKPKATRTARRKVRVLRKAVQKVVIKARRKEVTKAPPKEEAKVPQKGTRAKA